jgi:hypothetical protein
MKFEKDYVKGQIISAFNEEKFLSKHTVRLNLLNEDPEDIVNEMLKYAVENGYLRVDGDYYELKI